MGINYEYGAPPFPALNYCARCCIPETQEGQILDELGICQACQSSEQKIHINWAERQKQLKTILDEAKAKAGNNYDVILPISGGKDSTFQAYVLTQVYGMKCLAVTQSHNWYSETGWYNLFNLLERFKMDHVMFTPNRDLVNRIAKKSLGMIGDICWHCHSGPPAFVLKMAVAYNIPLIVWGESIAESSGRASYFDPIHKFDRDYFLKVSAKVPPDSMISPEISKKELVNFYPPSAEELAKHGIRGIHLGDFIFWDEERQVEFIREHWGWKESEIEGAYKGYKSVECVMSGMHDFTCYLKRGYGRATYQASVDVRNGLLSREDGFELIKKFDPEVPEALDYYLKATGMRKDEFYQTMEKFRKEKLEKIDLPLPPGEKKELFEKNKKKQFKNLKNMEIPVVPKTHKNREVIKPFVEQLLEKHSNRRDPREIKELNPNE